VLFLAGIRNREIAVHYKSMIIIRLSGGLGNQIFQLGAGLLLAESRGIKRIILDDKSLNSYIVKRENALPFLFNFNSKEYKIEVRALKVVKFRLPRLIPFRFKNFPLISDRNFEKVLEGRKGELFILDGYFQKKLSQVSFDKVVNLVSNIAYPQVNVLNKKSDCVIHIRGGDFIDLDWNEITPYEYYVCAISMMSQNYGVDKFIVITDDEKYAKSIVSNLNYNFKFINGDIVEDFYTIGAYSKRILSSSTFSFWASILGNSKNEKNILPQYWTPGIVRNIYLENEIRLINHHVKGVNNFTIES
jgi:hypothetical protein